MRLSILLTALALATSSALADWLQFRGTDTTGTRADAQLPTQLDAEKHVAWKTALPGRGLSSPLVIGDRVYLTAASTADQSRLHILCFSAADGAQLWERQFWATGRTICHKKTCVAAPTPTSDGKHIYALYSSNDLICVDLEGNLKWLRGLMSDYPNASNSLGLATSPVIAGDTLVVQIENDADSFAAGIDLTTGVNKWKTPRTRKANWTSPIVLPNGAVALQGSAGLTAIDAATGKELWVFAEGASTIPSSVAAADGSLLYVPSHGLTAIKPRADGNTPDIAWKQGTLRPGTASPIISGDKLLVINTAGVLNAANKNTGERLWKTRLEGPFSGSPVLAGGFLYIASERKGLLQCVDLSGEEGRVVGSIELGDMILGTPALSADALYVRSDGQLWKIAK
jgi:outer membrane protein assembly factor BamB